MTTTLLTCDAFKARSKGDDATALNLIALATSSLHGSTLRTTSVATSIIFDANVGPMSVDASKILDITL